MLTKDPNDLVVVSMYDLHEVQAYSSLSVIEYGFGYKVVRTAYIPCSIYLRGLYLKSGVPSGPSGYTGSKWDPYTRPMFNNSKISLAFMQGFSGSAGKSGIFWVLGLRAVGRKVFVSKLKV